MIHRKNWSRGLEGLVLASLAAGVIPACLGVWPGRILYLFLFGAVYGGYFLSYRRKGRLGLWWRFQLLEGVMAQLAGVLAGAGTVLVALFLMGGRDYGVPMLAGFIFGLLVLAIFPPFLVGAHLPLLILARRFVLKGVPFWEAWRLTMLGLGAWAILLAAGKGALSLYFRNLSQTLPETVSGPEITLKRFAVQGRKRGYAVLLDREFFHGRRVLSAELVHPGGESEYFYVEELDRYYFLWSFSPGKKDPGQAILRLSTEERVPFVGTRRGPFYEFPVTGVKPLRFFTLRRIYWDTEEGPALVVELESHFPARLAQVCFNFGGSPGLKAGTRDNYRDLRLRALSAYYLTRGGEEYYCYEPLQTPEAPFLGEARVRFPMPEEDFRSMVERGLVGTGRGPVRVRGLIRGEFAVSGFFQVREVEEKFEAELAFPE